MSTKPNVKASCTAHKLLRPGLPMCAKAVHGLLKTAYLAGWRDGQHRLKISLQVKRNWIDRD
jgi:hypothetical protein